LPLHADFDESMRGVYFLCSEAVGSWIVESKYEENSSFAVT